jgi:hypothetical protein
VRFIEIWQIKLYGSCEKSLFAEHLNVCVLLKLDKSSFMAVVKNHFLCGLLKLDESSGVMAVMKITFAEHLNVRFIEIGRVKLYGSRENHFCGAFECRFIEIGRLKLHGSREKKSLLLSISMCGLLKFGKSSAMAVVKNHF